MSIKSVAHVSVRTSDLPATLDFYIKGLGMTKHFDFVKEGKVLGCYLKAENETFVEIFVVEKTMLLKPGPQGEQFTLVHFCLQTDSVVKLHRRLTDLGYAVREPTVGTDGAPQLWVTDPSGLNIEFQEYVENCSQLTRRDVQRT